MDHKTEKKTLLPLLPFLLQFPILFSLPFVIWYINTPTNVFHTNPWGELSTAVAYICAAIISFCGLPVGIGGLIYSKEYQQLRIPTRILSIINIVIGSLPWIGLIILFCAILFFGANH